MNDIRVFQTSQSLKNALSEERSFGKTIGFVPTMGALHEGHLALVERALKETGRVVVSIFVNPTQFTNPTDLEKYPRTLEKDIELLRTVGEVFVFAPPFTEVYPPNDVFSPLELDGLDRVLEGEFRPGHFQGVVHVVRNFFRIVEPEKAFFGLKDFQQVAVIKLMTRKLGFNIEIVACPTLRESSGLALSSRNMRLNPEEKSESLIIYRTLNHLIDLKRENSPAEAKIKAESFFNQGKLKLEYLEIVDGQTLKPLDSGWGNSPTCCIAAFCGDVRLIDNMPL